MEKDKTPYINWIPFIQINTDVNLVAMETRGPWATWLTWEKQFKSINIKLIKRRKNNIIYFMRIYCFFIWRILNPPHPSMLCAKIGWNWLSGSGEEDFLISSVYFHYFIIISPWKRAGPFIWTNLNPLHLRMLCAKFGWNWPSGSGEKDENVKSLQTDRQKTDKKWSEKLTWAFSSVS